MAKKYCDEHVEDVADTQRKTHTVPRMTNFLYESLVSAEHLDTKLNDSQKSTLSEWISNLESTETLKNIYYIICQHYKERNNLEHLDPYPYDMKYHTHKNIKSPMFALENFPVQLQNILWNFRSLYIMNKVNSVN